MVFTVSTVKTLLSIAVICWGMELELSNLLLTPLLSLGSGHDGPGLLRAAALPRLAAAGAAHRAPLPLSLHQGDGGQYIRA